MPSSWISLKAIFDLAIQEGNEVSQFRNRLLEGLQSGAIAAEAAEQTKSNIVCSMVALDINELLAHLKRYSIGPFSSPDELLKNGHFFANNQYYTVRSIKGRFELYEVGDYNERFVGGDLNQQFMEHAWIDESRGSILCEDLDNLSRREYEKVVISQKDLSDMLLALRSAEPNKRGPKVKYYDEAVVRKATQLLLHQPTIPKPTFETKVRDWLQPRDPGDTTFQKYYGKLWTDNRRRSHC